MLVWLMLRSADLLKSKLPPGPRPFLFFGNLFDIPSKSPWETYATWRQQYGADLLHLTIFQHHIIVINSYSVAVDLLDKRSAIYSDKPVLMALNSMGWGFNLAFLCYDDPHRRIYRRLIHQGLGMPSIHDIQETLSKGSQEFLFNLQHDPENFLEYAVQYAVAMILQRTYGFTNSMKDYQNEIYHCALEAIDIFSESVFFGAQVVFAFPALAHLPSWFPGEEPFHVMKAHMSHSSNRYNLSGKRSLFAVTSWLSSMLGEQVSGDVRVPTESDIQGATASAWSGTFSSYNHVLPLDAHNKIVHLDSIRAQTSSALQSGFLAMVLYPEVQPRAQEEIDRVVGRHRLPSFEDHEALPYICAICWEIVRWHSPAPLTGRATSKPDVYMGYEIPQDTVVMVNLWEMSRDPDTFKDPDRFIPERFLKNDVLRKDVPDLMWGFGRRVCAGRVFAESTLWIAIARVLAVYNLTKDGDVREQYTNSGLFLRPLPFKCSFRLRFPVTKLMISEES
ncbi:uncharacterized protein ARMOST_21188 [Armillaria ostoyae]|uniref:Cytochrome P450 CYP2 subfamily n=1 Tax=Armillaria ostoyae TaxID=47428 RepID=A0A284S9D9_ARMOS|nr:uncharacterized protein ARMOST_21188 [Armillaria ostoyae]